MHVSAGGQAGAAGYVSDMYGVSQLGWTIFVLICFCVGDSDVGRHGANWADGQRNHFDGLR